MAEDVLYRFPWGSLDKARSDRALREALQAKFGARIDDEAAPSEEPPPDDIEYEVAIPARFAQEHHRSKDAPLPEPQEGHFMGMYWLRADDEGALLTLPWRDNAHVWGIMTEIVDTVATSLGGWREAGEIEETTDPSIAPRKASAHPPAPSGRTLVGSAMLGPPPPARRPSSMRPAAPAAPPRPASIPPPGSSSAAVDTLPRPPGPQRIPTPTAVIAVPGVPPSVQPPPASVEPTPNTKPSVFPGPSVDAEEEPVQLPLDEGDASGDLEDESDRIFPGWDALKSWVAEAYSIDEDEGETFSLTMTWSATPRKQLVSVARTMVNDEAWITFRSGVCRRAKLSPDQALRRSSELPFARMVFEKDRYDLVYSFPLPGLTVGRFTDLLERIAETADDLENEITRGGDEF